jgi:hypothetical protein
MSIFSTDRQRQTNEQTHACQVDIQTDNYKYIQKTQRQTDRPTDRQKDAQTYGQTDRQETDRQTEAAGRQLEIQRGRLTDR